ncbi:MAG TPA: HK97 family phage prohead protease [Gaiellaceae bacterium]|nr:HK97 family phage prohead protease [Gaiellaceae bacterium]
MTATAARAERRTLIAPAQLTVHRSRAAGGPTKVRGTAVVFNAWTELLPGVFERVAPGALDGALAAAPDLLLCWSHDAGEPLARRGKGMTVRSDARGLHFEAELADTQRARDVEALIDAGVLDGCSFAFTIADEDVEQRSDGTYFTVNAVGRLFELTLTAMPAYPQTSVEAARSTPSDALLREIRARRAALRVSERSPYGPTSTFSWFRDLERVHRAAAEMRRQEREGLRRIGLGLPPVGDMPANRDDGTLDDAVRRLRSVERPDAEKRAVGTSAMTGMIDSATLVPEFIEATFHQALRIQAVLANALPQQELPPGFVVPSSAFGNTLLTTGTTAGVQTSENTAPATQDPVGAETTLNPATITGKVTISRQLLERAKSVDMIIARDLGSAAGASLETEVIAGSGSGGHLKGLKTVAGTTAAYTDATPTVAELWPVLWQLRSLVASAAFEIPAIVALHFRRWAWMHAAIDGQNAWAAFTEGVDLRVIETGGIPTTDGAGTNQDSIIMLTPSSVVLFTRPYEVIVDEQSGGPQSVTFASWQFADLVTRAAVAVGLLSGTGLAAPAGF